MPESRDALVTLGEAQDRLGVTRFKLSQWIKTGKLTVYQSERDRRERLIRVGDVERLLQPQPMTEQSKIAA
jgi:predicted site-specific integrase-resolvase